ncbi:MULTISPECIES: hypothetical protein [Amycolatopsis]|uniref:hypothetical protein n=1 Tax=Amycolatopsis TaxID=1813 RepID=UPI000B8AC67C|nr:MULTISPECIES: hypothetical protein [Amycolatopsis]OXM72716.1 hypothetical protein CF166_13965 [Amycolatopsis sp. KNN50.9b]
MDLLLAAGERGTLGRGAEPLADFGEVTATAAESALSLMTRSMSSCEALSHTELGAPPWSRISTPSSSTSRVTCARISSPEVWSWPMGPM